MNSIEGYNLEKKKERRRMKVDNVIPDGEDDGTAGKKMILAMVDEVLEKRALAAQLSTGFFLSFFLCICELSTSLFDCMYE